VTTISWRLAHLVVGVLGARTPPTSTARRPPTRRGPTPRPPRARSPSSTTGYARWVEGVRGLGAEGLARPCGPAEGPYADEPLAALVTHIHREVIHHGAEIALLRDLYAHRTDGKAA
jgi:hypothetical protein